MKNKNIRKWYKAKIRGQIKKLSNNLKRYKSSIKSIGKNGEQPPKIRPYYQSRPLKIPLGKKGFSISCLYFEVIAYKG